MGQTLGKLRSQPSGTTSASSKVCALPRFMHNAFTAYSLIFKATFTTLPLLSPFNPTVRAHTHTHQSNSGTNFWTKCPGVHRLSKRERSEISWQKAFPSNFVQRCFVSALCLLCVCFVSALCLLCVCFVSACLLTFKPCTPNTHTHTHAHAYTRTAVDAIQRCTA